MTHVVIYTTPICPYCIKAKKLFQSKGVIYEEIDVSVSENLRNAMMKKAEGRRSVPQIFINDKPIGGCDDLYALDQAGKLDDLLNQK